MNLKKIKYVFFFLLFATILELTGAYTYISANDFEEVTNTLGNKVRVHYIDVGQGDSTFIELPDGKTVLIDAGESEYGQVVASYIEKLKYSKIDYLIATHPHNDHIGGLTYIVNSFDIGAIYMPDVTNNTSTYINLLKAIEAKKKKVRVASIGKNIILEDELCLKVLAPSGKEYEDLNNYSVVLKLTFKEKSFLFMADAQYDSEMDILNSGLDISADVLRVGHHGSTSSTNYNFLKKVSPKIAIISVGLNNDYGHPKEKILNKLKDLNVKIYRTDLNGNIVITTDGETMKVKVDNGSYS